MPAPARPRWLVLTALALVTLNLRTALSSVPAVESDIEAATGWSATVIGALTMLPVLCMGIFALVVPRLARRIGRRETVAVALVLITVALLVRLGGAIPGVLHASALLAGIGIALAAGLVPAVVREQLPQQVGLATGLWTAAMMTGAALGGALTVPLATALDSWQAALAFWAIPAALAATVWWLVEESHHQHDSDRATTLAQPPVRVSDLPWRVRPAWALSGYLLLNSVVFYTALAWLAPMHVDQGSSTEAAGLLLGAFTVAQIAGALVLPGLAERLPARRAVFAVVVSMTGVALVAIAVAPSSAPLLATSVFGLMLGGGFAMGLALLSEWAADPSASARLTAMAYSVTYVVAAFGPLLAGGLLDATGSWTLVFGLLAAVCAVQLLTVRPLRRGVLIS
jgi:CP family cyanate transporter-like MFS transporter